MDVRSWNRDQIGYVQFARPATQNALDARLVDGLRSALRTLAATEEVRCVVLAGAGPSFSVGGDLEAVRRQSVAETLVLNDAVLAAADELDGCPVPTIAALHGHVLGGGLELALACTLRVAAADARLGLPEVRLGLLPGGGGIARLPSVVGPGHARRLLLTGAIVEAEEAHRVGLVDAVASAGALQDEVDTMARRIAEAAPLALRAVRDILRGSDAADIGARQSASDAHLVPLLESADRREGLAAFAERRPPRFEGR